MAISTEKKVGLFFLLTLLALGVLIEVVEDWNPFEKRVDYHTFFESTIGLKTGDPVRMAGVDVGKVRNIELEDGRVRVDFYAQKGTRIKEDAVARLRRTNLLGGQFLGLDFGSEGSAPLPPGAEVKSEEGASLDQLITSFDRNQKKVLNELGHLIEGPINTSMLRLESIVGKIDRGEGMLGRMVNDPTLYEQLTAAVSSLQGLLQQLKRSDGTFGRLLNDPTLYEEARLTVTNLRNISDRLQAGEGTLGRLFTDDKLYNQTTDILGQIREIAAKANNGTGSLGLLVNDPALYEEVRGTMARVNSIAGKIDDGKGTLGRLVNEDDLYRDAKTTLHKVDKTVDGMSDSGPLSALGVVMGTLF